MDLRDCQQLALAVARTYNDDGDPFRGLARVLEEAGEVAAEIARLEKTGSKGFFAEPGDLSSLEDELADVLINLAGLANTYQLDLSRAMERKRSQHVETHGPDSLLIDDTVHPDVPRPRVAVYCSSSNQLDQAYYDAATELGRLIGRRQWTVVYGGGSLGLMGAVSRTAKDHGSEVLGIILDVLIERGGDNSHVAELESVSTMRSRKRRLDDLSDAFVALPGGFGTLEEITEVLSFKQLGFHHRPIILLNTLGFYDGLLQHFARTFDDRFATRGDTLYTVAQLPEDVVAAIESSLQSRTFSQQQ